ncbi:DEAD/DEAH box helicase [Pseudomonas luteola]|uniref:SNF2-related protein n=1 Tax=Pseudomonas luteola TaxID=47886 RepID=UPI003A85E8B1
MNAMIPPLYAHQEEDAEFMSRTPRVINTSDPGTGKSRTVLEAFSRMKERDEIDFLLVLAPLSILGPSWAADCRKYTPHLEASVVTAKNKWKGMPPQTMADIFITNHDSVKWLLEGWQKDDKRWGLCIDEFTVYKHATSQRSKAIRNLRGHFGVRWILSGTPNPNGIVDIWHPAFLTDDGERLGKVMSGFRMQVCTPEQGHMGTIWKDKPNAEILVADRLKDIAVRRKFEECLDVPENVMRTLEVDLPAKLMKAYREMQREAALEHDNGTLITAIHAGAKAQKLLQLCSGAMYDNEGGYQVFDTTRTDLVLELIQQRAHSVVAFNWRHQKDLLIAGAEKLGITYGVIDGSVPVKEREVIVNRYQAGQLQTVFCHPQSAGHGLTFTKGTATIWPSPTSNAEHFQQFNRRIYRAGQTQRTETICIAANGTKETDVYTKLNAKLVRMDDLLSMLLNLTK